MIVVVHVMIISSTPDSMTWLPCLRGSIATIFTYIKARYHALGAWSKIFHLKSMVSNHVRSILGAGEMVNESQMSVLILPLPVI